MHGKDLGTYHVRVELVDETGFIYEWGTGARYMNGSGGIHPLDATRIEPTWKSEQELFETIIFQFTDGNYSCDCNKRLFLARAHQQEEPEEPYNKCGDTMPIKKLTAIRPDGTEVVLVERSIVHSKV